MRSPFDKGMLSPFSQRRNWWGFSAPLGSFAYDTKGGRYMQGGTSVNTADALTEGRSTSAYVLGVGGNYILRGANEPAQADGHGLDGFDETVNMFVSSRRITAINHNFAAPVAYTGTTPFGDVGGRVYTSTGIEQTNTSITADSAAYVFSKHFKPLSSGAKFKSVTFGIAGVDSAGCVFDFDTLTTDSGRAPIKIQTLSDGWVRLSWLFQNDGTGATLIWREDVTVDSDYASDQTDHTQGSIVYPPIITTGTALTRDADDTRIVQGEGPELVTNGTFDTADDWIFLNALPGISGGVCKVENDSASEGAARQVFPVEPNVFYTVSFDITAASGGTGAIILGNQRQGGFGVGSHVITYAFVTGGSNIELRPNTGGIGNFVTFDNVSVKAVTIAPGFTANPNELTFRVDWDGVAQTGVSRYLFETVNSSGAGMSLIILLNSEIWFGGNGSGSFQKINTLTGFDDGGAHTAICYCNRTTNEFKLSVDGEATISGTLTSAFPPNIDEMALSLTDSGTGNLNGTNCRIVVSEGDAFETFKAGVPV